MWLLRNGESTTVENTVYTIGDTIHVTSGEFEGLYGNIVEIRTDEDKETENEGNVDVYLCLVKSTNKKINARINKTIREMSCGTMRGMDDFGIDLLILPIEEFKIV